MKDTILAKLSKPGKARDKESVIKIKAVSDDERQKLRVSSYQYILP